MNKFFFLPALLFCSLSFGASTDRYWIATTTENWNDASNWSLTLNGSASGGVPQTNDNCIFDGSNKGNCLVDINISMNKIETKNGFAASIIIQAATVTIGNGNLIHGSGTFNCDRANLTITGDILISGEFIATSGTMIVGGDFSVSDPEDFDPSTGTIFFNSITSNTISGGPSFYHAIFKGVSGGTSTITAASGFNVCRDFTVEEVSGDIEFDGDMISIGGDLTMQSVWQVGTAEINMTGHGNQQIIVTGNATFSNLCIDKISGNVIAKDTIVVEDTLKLKSGDILIGNAHAIKLGSSAIVTDANENSFVDGTIVKTGSVDFTFPCGSVGAYGPVEISNLSGSQQVICRFYSRPTPFKAELDSITIQIDSCAYWIIEGESGETAQLGFYPLEHIGCLELNTSDDYIILRDTSDTWWSQVTNSTGDKIIGASQTPTGNYTLGSLGESRCVDGPLYWVGSYSNDWDEAENWSSTSGGPGGYGIPCDHNTVIFDGNGNIDCDVNSNVEVAKALFRPDYTAEIATNGFQLRIIELFK